MVSVEKLIAGLAAFRDDEFSCDGVYRYLDANPVDPDSVSPFMYFSQNFYTRNLIYKDERFEMMAICWEKGQASRVHDHADQKCWMAVTSGRLRGQNFRVAEMDESKGFCRLEKTDRFDLAACVAAKVELEEPIHQVINLPEFDERAVSLHIYSRPYSSCRSYCLDTNTFKDVELFYTSIDGKLCEGIVL